MRRFLMVLGGLALLTLPVAAQAAEGDDSAASLMKAMGMGGLDGDDLAKAVKAADAHPLGSKDNPVRVDGPEGEHGYLRRLRCQDGAAPSFNRFGNVGMGVFGNIVDGYTVTCAGAQPVQVFMDMYHPDHVESRAVPGFGIS